MADDKKISELFEKYDTNKNGVLEKGEFKVIFKKILKEMGEDYPEKRNDQVFDEAFLKYDLNGNGTIEYDEFATIINFLVEEKGYKLE